MRAFLAADSCPSRCRRATSCSSWVAQGLVTKMGPHIPSPQGHCTEEETGSGREQGLG